MMKKCEVVLGKRAGTLRLALGSDIDAHKARLNAWIAETVAGLDRLEEKIGAIA